MFAKVDVSKLKLLAFTSQLLTCKPGEVLIKVNDPSDCVYLVMDGELEILSKTTCGRDQSIIRQRGDLIGRGELGCHVASARFPCLFILGCLRYHESLQRAGFHGGLQAEKVFARVYR